MEMYLQKWTILIVSNENYNGTYETDPFYFDHKYINVATFLIDYVPVGGLGMNFRLTDQRENKFIYGCILLISKG